MSCVGDSIPAADALVLRSLRPFCPPCLPSLSSLTLRTYSQIVPMILIFFKSVFLFFFGSWDILQVVLRCLSDKSYGCVFSGAFSTTLFPMWAVFWFLQALCWFYCWQLNIWNPSHLFHLSAFPRLPKSVVMFCDLEWSLGSFLTVHFTWAYTWLFSSPGYTLPSLNIFIFPRIVQPVGSWSLPSSFPFLPLPFSSPLLFFRSVVSGMPSWETWCFLKPSS